MGWWWKGVMEAEGKVEWSGEPRAREWRRELVCGGGGFIHLFPFVVEVWYELMEREASSLATAHSAHGLFLLFHLFAICGFLDLQVDLLSLSSVQTSLNCFLSSFGPCAALLVHCLH